MGNQSGCRALVLIAHDMDIGTADPPRRALHSQALLCSCFYGNADPKCIRTSVLVWEATQILHSLRVWLSGNIYLGFGYMYVNFQEVLGNLRLCTRSHSPLLILNSLRDIGRCRPQQDTRLRSMNAFKVQTNSIYWWDTVQLHQTGISRVSDLNLTSVRCRLPKDRRPCDVSFSRKERGYCVCSGNVAVATRKHWWLWKTTCRHRCRHSHESEVLTFPDRSGCPAGSFPLFLLCFLLRLPFLLLSF